MAFDSPAFTQETARTSGDIFSRTPHKATALSLMTSRAIVCQGFSSADAGPHPIDVSLETYEKLMSRTLTTEWSIAHGAWASA